MQYNINQDLDASLEGLDMEQEARGLKTLVAIKELKQSTNGWTGFYAKEEIRLLDGQNGIYLVTYTAAFTHKTWTYRTLKGAEIKFNKLDDLMVKK